MLKRREALIAGAGMLSSAWLGEQVVFAADTPPASGQAGYLQALNACIGAGQTCLQHCFQLLQTGDTSLAKCAEAVNLMLAITKAAGTFVVGDSRYRAQIVQLTTSVCEDCEHECRKHEKDHPVCKSCADVCAASVRAAVLIS